MICFQNYQKLIQKMAWSFHRSSGIEYEELYSEACAAFARAYRKYDPERGAFSTLLHHSCKHQLLGYIADQKKQNIIPREKEAQETLTPESWAAFREALGNLKRDGREIYKIILNSPSEYFTRSHGSQSKLQRKIEEETGLPAKRIQNGFRMIRKLLNECR